MKDESISKPKRSCLWYPIIFVGFSVLGCLLFSIWIIFASSNPIGSLISVGEGKTIRIFHSSDLHVLLEPYSHLKFEVREGTKLIHEGCGLIFDQPGDKHQFKKIYSANKSIVGVQDLASDSLMFIMCNLETDICYPCDANDSERNAMFAELQQANEDLKTPWFLEPQD
jgi:hypothetical protein